jgi:hypothetical protein
VFRATPPTHLEAMDSSMEIERVEVLAKPSEYYCSLCEKTCGTLKGYGGRWQKVGEKQWLYLCKTCDHDTWRDFYKLEEFYDSRDKYKQYWLFLQNSLQAKYS